MIGNICLSSGTSFFERHIPALILALLEIFHDVRNFMVVLVVVIFMFG